MTIEIQNTFDLSDLNTFRLSATCHSFHRFDSNDDLAAAVNHAVEQGLNMYLLGGGSNVLLAPYIDGLVLQSADLTIVVEDETVRVGAGVIWDDLVAEMLSQRLYGLENLSGIPGTVGAAPVQNIGAYGVELSQFVDSVEVFDLATQTLRRLSATDCDFGYRSSRFRTLTASPYIITAVNLRLSREYRPNLSYPDLAGLPTAIGGSADSLRAEILAIRQRKLPDYRQLGNVGSFFKNPMISAAQKSLLEASGISSGFNRSQDGFKVSAARLIELAVDSRHRVGDARISSRHRLVLENAGRATLADVLALAKAIQASVNAKFGVELEIEPTTLQPLALSR